MNGPTISEDWLVTGYFEFLPLNITLAEVSYSGVGTDRMHYYPKVMVDWIRGESRILLPQTMGLLLPETLLQLMKDIAEQAIRGGPILMPDYVYDMMRSEAYRDAQRVHIRRCMRTGCDVPAKIQRAFDQMCTGMGDRTPIIMMRKRPCPPSIRYPAGFDPIAELIWLDQSLLSKDMWVVEYTLTDVMAAYMAWDPYSDSVDLERYYENLDGVRALYWFDEYREKNGWVMAPWTEEHVGLNADGPYWRWQGCL